jgi:hypothetical protein
MGQHAPAAALLPAAAKSMLKSAVEHHVQQNSSYEGERQSYVPSASNGGSC